METGESMPGPRSTFLLVELSPGQSGCVIQRLCCILGVGDMGTMSRVEKGKTFGNLGSPGWRCEVVMVRFLGAMNGLWPQNRTTIPTSNMETSKIR